MTIPYVQGQSEVIKRILKSLDVQIVFRPLKTLRMMISRPKDHTPTLLQILVVCNISCQGCYSSYVDQTGRNLEQCMKEYKTAVKQQNVLPSSALAEHVC